MVSGAWMLAVARWMAPAGNAERNPTISGCGMTMPIDAASRSMRWASASDAIVVRSCSLRIWSCEVYAIDRPMLALIFSTGPGYFHTLGIPLIQGREFTPADAPGAPRVAIVNELLARRMFPGERAVGRTLEVIGRSAEWTSRAGVVTIVGVAANVKNFSNDTVPTLIVAAQNDSIAPVRQHALVFYNSIPATQPKMYLELAGASHTATNRANTTQAQYEIPWLKRFIDNDTRYDQFLCPLPVPSTTIAAYQGNCPHV